MPFRLDAQRATMSLMSRFEVFEISPAEAGFADVLALAASISGQDRQLEQVFPHAASSHVLVAVDGRDPLGFLRLLIQVIGAEEGRPPVRHEGRALTEGYVEAFGVRPDSRRRGIGSALQAQATAYALTAGCHQMRSRSPVTSTANYALKIRAGYSLSPSEVNDSYYFTRVL